MQIRNADTVHTIHTVTMSEKSIVKPCSIHTSHLFIIHIFEFIHEHSLINVMGVKLIHLNKFRYF